MDGSLLAALQRRHVGMASLYKELCACMKWVLRKNNGVTEHSRRVKQARLRQVAEEEMLQGDKDCWDIVRYIDLLQHHGVEDASSKFWYQKIDETRDQLSDTRENQHNYDECKKNMIAAFALVSKYGMHVASILYREFGEQQKKSKLSVSQKEFYFIASHGHSESRLDDVLAAKLRLHRRQLNNEMCTIKNLEASLATDDLLKLRRHFKIELAHCLHTLRSGIDSDGEAIANAYIRARAYRERLEVAVSDELHCNRVEKDERAKKMRIDAGRRCKIRDARRVRREKASRPKIFDDELDQIIRMKIAECN